MVSPSGNGNDDPSSVPSPGASKSKAPDGSRSGFSRVVRNALSGRSREIVALSLFALAVICALGLLGDRAGIVGRVLESALAILLGVFRYVVPILLVWIGVALARMTSSERSGRAAFGLSMLTVAFAAAAHLSGSADGFGSLEDLRGSGGVLGAVVAEPLRRLIDDPATWVLLLLVMLFAVMIVANIGLSQVLRWIWTGLSALGQKLSGSLSKGARSLQRVGEDPEPPSFGEEQYDLEAEPAGQIPGLEPAAPGAGEAASDEAVFEPSPPQFVELPGDDPVPTPVRAASTASKGTGSGSQRPRWKLPKKSMLKRSGTQQFDRAQLSAGAAALVAALASHGVETQVTGWEPGPTVTRYELKLGTGRESVARHSAPQRHRLRHGRCRCPDPRADPGPVGDRHRGSQFRPSPGRARRHPVRQGRSRRHAPTRSGHGQGHLGP